MNTKFSIGLIVVLVIGLATSFANMSALKSANEGLTAEAAELSDAVTALRGQEPQDGPSAEVTLDPEELAKTINDNRALSDKLKALEDAMAEKDRLLASLQKESETDTEKAEEKKDEPRRDWSERRRDYMAELKEKDPERYKELEDRRTTMRKHVTDTMTSQSAFILSLDESKMTEEQLANHNALTEILDRNWELMEISGNDEDPDAQGKARMELMRNVFSMGELLGNEREVALEDMGRQMGYDDKGSTAFSDSVQDVYKMTSVRSYMPTGMGRGGWGRGGHDRSRDGGDKSKKPESSTAPSAQ